MCSEVKLHHGKQTMPHFASCLTSHDNGKGARGSQSDGCYLRRGQSMWDCLVVGGPKRKLGSPCPDRQWAFLATRLHRNVRPTHLPLTPDLRSDACRYQLSFRDSHTAFFCTLTAAVAVPRQIPSIQAILGFSPAYCGSRQKMAVEYNRTASLSTINNPVRLFFTTFRSSAH